MSSSWCVMLQKNHCILALILFKLPLYFLITNEAVSLHHELIPFGFTFLFFMQIWGEFVTPLILCCSSNVPTVFPQTSQL